MSNRGLSPELVEEAKADLAFWEDLGVVEQMRQDASGWVGLVARLVEQYEAREKQFAEALDLVGDAANSEYKRLCKRVLLLSEVQGDLAEARAAVERARKKSGV